MGEISKTTSTGSGFTTTMAYKSYTNSLGQMTTVRKNPYYKYSPSVPGSVIFAVLFAIALVVMVGQVVYFCRKRTVMERTLLDGGGSAYGGGLADSSVKKENTFESTESTTFVPVKPCTNTRLVTKFLPLLIGLGTECGGYIARIVSKKDVFAIGPYVAQTVMLLVAAAFMAATIYMNFGRLLVVMNATKVSFVPIRFSTAIFVTGDVVSILLQAAGGAILGTSDNDTLGSNIVIGGLAIQVAIFGLFVITEIRFLCLGDKVSPITACISRQWKVLNINLFVCSILILIRSIIRLIEFIQGYSGYIMVHEWFLFVFDGMVMILVVVLFIGTFPKGNLFKVEFECTYMLKKPSYYAMRDA
ncbi:LANO_0C08856g1_1 [Lachancea nothofagi CBS 11611]|uniref:LANO_0C08856g1_1 n=1 Tax=Lachancea nothofagi CBS 11611 TaxID=1266666 RepID=A0A1G4J9H4_9SACH|nr:LANO_0C08856g1_1 [Lachancea nothofagi CBS 11611]